MEYVFPRIRSQLLHHHFFLSKAVKGLLKTVTSWCINLRHWLLLHLFLLPKATKCLLKNATSWWVLSRFLWMAPECWPLNAALHKTLSLRLFRRKFYTIKDGSQTYNFITDKSCLLFFIILKVLSRWQVIRTQGKCINHIRIFEKILWLSKTSLVWRATLKYNSIKYNYKLSVRDCCHLGRPDDWEFGSLFIDLNPLGLQGSVLDCESL